MNNSCVILACLFSILGVSVCAQEQQPLADDIVGSQGNWVRKREWLKESLALNDEIQQLAVDIAKSRTAFFTEFANVDGKSNEFFSSKAMNRGSLNKLLTEVKEYLESRKKKRLEKAQKEAEAEGAPINLYDVQEEEIVAEHSSLLTDVTQFELDVSSIKEIDASLSERLQVVSTQIESAQGIADEARKITEEIWHIIDDLKARERYYELLNTQESLKTIKTYITQTLLDDFKKVIQSLMTQIAKVEEEITELEENGIIVAHRAKRLEEREREKKRKKAEAERSKHQKKKKRKKQANTTWYDTATSLPDKALDFLRSSVSSAYVFLFGED